MMTAKEYLRQYKEAAHRADILREEYKAELLQIDAIRSPMDTDGSPRGGGVGKVVEVKAIRLAEKALEYKRAEVEALEVKQEVFDLVKEIPGEYGRVLYHRYILLEPWHVVADAVGYSERQVHNLHRAALAMVAEKIA